MKNLLIMSALLMVFAFTSCKNEATKPNLITQDSSEVKILAHPEWSKSANIYEVNIRQYTKEGTFNAFETHLDRLKAMGVDILWIMPINPIGIKNRKGGLGSYYSISDYKVVNPEFGSLQDFKNLVDSAHAKGMHIIVDWVANHTAWDHVWIAEHSNWFEKDSLGNFISPFDWTDVISLDYNNKEMRAAMIDALKYWVTEANIDGYRCDVAEMVPVDFWDEARLELDKIKPVFMLAEAEVPVHHKQAFDMSYGWELHHIMNNVAQGKANVHDIDKYLMKQDSLFTSNDYRMLFLDNHDENSWNGTIEKRMKNAAPAFAVLASTLPGMFLLYSGQEAGLNKSLKFFEKDEINWKKLPMEAFYSQLLNLKTNNKALWNGDFGGIYRKILTDSTTSILAYSREKDGNTVVVILNLSKKPIKTTVDFKELSGEFTNAFSAEKVNLSSKMEFNLKAWDYLIFTK